MSKPSGESSGSQNDNNIKEIYGFLHGYGFHFYWQ
jgi:hypothetical protein